MTKASRQNYPALSADVGGTFTDIVLDTGESSFSTKVLTDYKAPEKAILAGMAKVLAEADLDPSDIVCFAHGTTLATNAVLERKGAKTALLTTNGFRDVLEIGYEGRHDALDLNLRKQTPVVSRDLRYTVTERVASDGSIIIPLDTQSLISLSRQLEFAKVESLAIGFLHSYTNPDHEIQAREIIQEQLPALPICISSEICPEIREYERLSTVSLNAYVQPAVSVYLRNLEVSLREYGISCPVLIMASSGGLVPISYALSAPIRLIESGPAGGAVLASKVAAELGERNVVSFDMGGTTAKICFIRDFKPRVARLFEVDRSARFRPGSGLPLRVPVVELVEIGAGGGSIGRVDSLQRITVGPDSASSEPGPACYGRGGEHATVTDADFLLGKIDPDRFAAGDIRLDKELSRASIAKAISSALSCTDLEAAYGITEIVDETMANAARAHAVELGGDLSSNTMISFGGAAPLHAARIAQKLGISRIIIPNDAGVGSAVGFLRAPMAFDIAVGAPVHLSDFNTEHIERAIRIAEDQLKEALKDSGDEKDISKETVLGLRYVGQGHEIEISYVMDCNAATLRKKFENKYAGLFGRVLPGAEIEVVSLRIRITKAIGENRPTSLTLCRDREFSEYRASVFDIESGEFTSISAFERTSLRPGFSVEGPALIKEDQTTTVVPDGFSLTVHDSGHLILDRQQSAGGSK